MTMIRQDLGHVSYLHRCNVILIFRFFSVVRKYQRCKERRCKKRKKFSNFFNSSLNRLVFFLN